MTYKMVLSNSLLITYENLAFDYSKNQRKYKRLMKLMSFPYNTNKRQLLETKFSGMNQIVIDRLLPQMLHLENRNASLEELAKETSLKVILTEDKDAALPYVYYRSKFMSNQITISLTASDSRENLIKYLQMLCSNATKVTICDNYFAHSWENTQSIFRSIFPRHRLEIQFIETPDSLPVLKNSSTITNDFVQSIYKDWSVSESTHYKNSHDRYLLIESPQGKVEVMVSSGFDHIWKANPKEVTCVFREI